MPKPVLATVYHDPRGVLVPVIARLWPPIADVFDAWAVVVTQAAGTDGVEALRRLGARTATEDHPPAGMAGIGKGRRNAVALALTASPGRILYSDLDHVLRWGEIDPEDLVRTLDASATFDLCVVGRTEAAIEDLPATLRDTERIVNRVFAEATGWAWDVMSGVRVLSGRAAREIVGGCHDDTIANDVSWPLHLRSGGGFAIGYAEAKGLVYEDNDQFVRREDRGAWRRRLEADPARWASRLELALMDVRAIASYA